MTEVLPVTNLGLYLAIPAGSSPWSWTAVSRESCVDGWADWNCSIVSKKQGKTTSQFYPHQRLAVSNDTQRR